MQEPKPLCPTFRTLSFPCSRTPKSMYSPEGDRQHSWWGSPSCSCGFRAITICQGIGQRGKSHPDECLASAPRVCVVLIHTRLIRSSASDRSYLSACRTSLPKISHVRDIISPGALLSLWTSVSRIWISSRLLAHYTNRGHLSPPRLLWRAADL